MEYLSHIKTTQALSVYCEYYVAVCIVGLLTIIGCIVIASQHPSQSQALSVYCEYYVTVCIVGLLTIIGCIIIASQHPSQLSWSFGLGCTAGIYILVMASIYHSNLYILAIYIYISDSVFMAQILG